VKKKLALNLDNLSVKTFHTSPTELGRRGTVQGHSGLPDDGSDLRPPGDTFAWPCEVSQGGSCELSCWAGTCRICI
jgi:hypothetical protein